uniref:sperm-specific sodium:proton exchanger-like isoform X2 n=1 Tax=Pristiophorus japonicus TaxID=55135 RepID=UPI00398F830F
MAFPLVKVRQYSETLANINPLLIIHAFMPVLIFSSAFEIESHIFLKSLSQVVLLAGPGMILSSAMIALLAVKVYTFNWDWYVGLMFGSILGCTDPVTAVALLRNLGASKALTLIIEGESLLNDGTSIVMFEVFRELALHPTDVDSTELAIKLLLKVLVSPIFGYGMAKITMFCLSYIFNDGLTEITMILAITYITFYIGEWLGMSGVISVTFMGLFMDTVSFSPEIEVFLVRFWEMLTYLANTLIFMIVGIVISQRSLENMTINDGFFIIVLYFGLNTIRLVLIVGLSPLLSRLGSGFNWRWAAVSIWSGTKGAFTLSLAVMAYQLEGLDEMNIRNKILLHVSGTVILTLLINGTTMGWIVNILGLSDIPAPKRMAMYSALQRIRESEANTFSLLKMDKFLADANWVMVEKLVQLEDPYKSHHKGVEVDDFLPNTKTAHCPDCERSIPWEPSLHEIDDMMEEARIRVLKAQKTSYWRQYSSGMLNRQAARTLMSITESTIDSGRFMTVIDVKKQWEIRGIFVIVRKKLEDWMYNIKVDKYKPPKNRILKLCYRTVSTNAFECFVYMVILLNVFPIILEYVPLMNIEHEAELQLINYIFFVVYVLEAIMKALALQKAYIFDHWNQFDLFILTLATTDILIDHLFERSVHKVRTVRIFKLVRLTRVLRLLKIMIPTFIHLLNKQINKQLSFGYDIGKGYVVGEEAIRNLIDHISDQKVISQQLRNIVLRNHQEAIKELGLLQRDHPEIAISVKTRQAIRTVLNSARDTIHALQSGGLLDDAEASKLEMMIEVKMKRLLKFPSSIQPPTAEELLKNLPWLQNAEKQIEFIKYKAKLLYFDYGDIIVYQDESPRGIHLIVSGMVRLHGVKPSFGVSSKGVNIDEDDDFQTEKSMPSFTDYKSSGAIIGELNCITQQKMEVTVTCETVAQTCYISIDDLFEAFDVFSEFPSLEYKIWLALGMRTATTIMMDDISYQGWSYSTICTHLARSYLVDIEKNNRFDLYDGTVEDVFLVYGSTEDVQSQKQYDAPCYIAKTTHQYKFRDLTIEELKNVHKKFPELKSSLDTYTFSDGSQKDLLNLIGTIPVGYKGSSYNIPIRMWILDSHPFGPPLCFLRPTSNMVIHEGKHVDVQGRIYLPYLQHWSHPKTDIIGLLNEMITKFQGTPPLYSKPSDDGPSPAGLNSYMADISSGLSEVTLQPKKQTGGRHFGKVTVLGGGDLGMACAMSILAKDVIEKLAFITTSENTMKGGTLDMEIFSLPRVETSKDFSDSAGSSVVIVTANTWGGEESYLQALQSNVDLFRTIIPNTVRYSPNCVLIIASQPVDVMTYVGWKLSGFPSHRVIGTGCNLDTQRFQFILGKSLKTSPAGKEAWIIGEHGDNEVAVWRGSEMDSGQNNNPDIIADHDKHKQLTHRAFEGLKEKGQRSWSVGLSVADLTETILRNLGHSHSVSTLVKGWYGISSEVFLSLPCALTAAGVVNVTALKLSEDEEAKLQSSAATLQNFLQQLKI